MKLSSEAQEFLWYSYFSKSYDMAVNDVGKAMLLCARRAYLDMNRTLLFATDDAKEHEEFCNSICTKIVSGIKNKLLFCDKTVFDENHANLCNHIIDTAKSTNMLECKNGYSDCFCYGQAQKWLNMTLKYMLIMGFWSKELKPIEDVLHVPVDSYIIEAVWDKKSIVLPMKNEGSRGKYNSDKVIPWSKWDKDMYEKFQNTLRNSDVLNNEIPIYWESHAWLEVAQKRNQSL